MDTLTASASIPFHDASYDEISVEGSVLLDDSVEDLKNLRAQLYSAAEYFELSYTNDDQKQMVVDTLKDYTIKALVNTMDHLGSVTFRVNGAIDEKVEEVSGTELLVSCIEQRLKTCWEYNDREGLAQQSSIIDAPRYHKRYVLPAEEPINGTCEANLKYDGCTLEDENDWHQSRIAACAVRRDAPSSLSSPSLSSSASSRKVCSVSPPPSRTSRLPGSTSGTVPKKEHDRRSVSPRLFPLPRSGSLINRPTPPKPSRPTTPIPSTERQEWLSMPCRSASVRVHDVRRSQKETQQQPSKSKRIFKSLLGRRKSTRDDTLYTYLDEY